MVGLSLWLAALNVFKATVYLDIFGQAVLDTCDVILSEEMNMSALPGWSHDYYI